MNDKLGGVLHGVGIVPGIAAGPVERMGEHAAPPTATSLPVDASADDAARRIADAADAVHHRLMASADRADGDQADVLRTTATMAVDPGLIAAAQTLVRTQRLAPQGAVWQVATSFATQFRDIGGLMAERGRDIEDVRDRIIAFLGGRDSPGIPDPGHPFVLVAQDLAPADAAQLDGGRVLAVVLGEGGPTSHTAILLRAQGIPTVMGVDGANGIRPGAMVVVDGAAGSVQLDPQPRLLGLARAAGQRRRRFSGPGQTSDGYPVPLLANIGRPGEAATAAHAGAEGIGLFRTEFCFLGHDEAPSVESQVANYRAVLAAFPGRRVVVRTLDAGADKPLPFIGVKDEPNPALGLRGLRTATVVPEVLDAQLAAIAEASTGEEADVWVMAPMVSTVDEANAFVDRCCAHGLMTAGLMIEVPAAALLSAAFLQRAVFASIGTNDLAQYTMAADRLLPRLGGLNSSWQPAVLRLIAEACRGARENDRPIGVCGEAAADPLLAPVLVGLGVSSLSMSPAALAGVDAVLSTVRHDDCVRLAERALNASSAAQAKEWVRQGLPGIG